MKTRSINSRTWVSATCIVSLLVLLFTMSGAMVQASPAEQGGGNPCAGCGCTPSCSGNCCTSASCAFTCSGGGSGGGNPGPPGGGGGGGSGGSGGSGGAEATTVASSGVVAVCGDGECNGGETHRSCPRDCGYPTPTPRPWEASGEDAITYNCVPWPDCPGGYAQTTVIYHWATDRFIVADVVCQAESECVAPTPEPGTTPTPGGGSTWPCNVPPIVDASGHIRQPCEKWPGWSITAEAQTPPAAILRNPWTRGLVGLPNCFWYLGSGDVENWSEYALECPAAHDGATGDSSTFDCGNGTTVAEGGEANYQIGVAWRQWREGSDPIFGYTPPAEITWMIHDREENGGTIMKTGAHICYTFETSSYGLEELGPVWNSECQDEECTDCDERVASYLGEASYMVNPTTFWWPEYAFKHLEYECSDMEWSDCGCYSEKPHWTTPTKGCSAPPGICIGEDEWYGRTGHCDEWKWTEVQDAWIPYDLTKLGFRNPVLSSVGVVVAGATTKGERCGSWVDAWPCYVPVPVLEIQPAGIPDQ